MDDLELRPMTEAEFTAFRSGLISSYAADKTQAGEWTPEEAQQRSAREFDDLLPDGRQTTGMLLLAALTPAGEPVGSVWIALRPGQSAASAWIYDIVVSAEHRGQGNGRALLAAAEREAARHGAAEIALNVFGANTVARGLYESSGYEVTALQMRKPLEPGGSPAR